MKLTCIHCGQDFTITHKQLGARGKCPHCTQVVEFPGATGKGQDDEKSRPGSLVDNSISGLGSVVIHLILLILICIVPWTGGDSGVGETYDVMIGVIENNQLDLQEETLELEQNDQAETIESVTDPVLESVTKDSPSEPLVNIDTASLSPSVTGAFDEQSFRSASAAGGGADFNGLIKQLKRDGLDIVICFDSTGSMGGEISVVKNKIQRIGSTLLKMIPKTRISICTYRDRGQTENYVVKGTPLTNSLNDVIGFLETVNAGGGGDMPEAVLDGMKWAVNNNQFHRRARKVILIFGDAPPHREDQSECLEIASRFKLQQKGIVSTVTCRRPTHLQEFSQIARSGGGESFLTSNHREIMTQLLVLVFGNRHRKKVLQAFQLLER
ncbi:MAG: vWA domain-containing protein [Planctomycetota bacterium]|nr:vWA domain-containing protein [Planctomycetota bacterium]